MIKVNLKTDRSLVKKEEAAAGTVSYSDVLKGQAEKSGMVPAAGKQDIHPLVKLAILLVPVVLVFLYEKKADSDAQKIMSQLSQDMRNVEEVKKQKQQQLEKNQGIIAELAVAEPVLNELKQIDYNRLLAVRALDNLQDVIPFQVWLRSVELDRSSINIDGLAVSDNDLTQFQQNLESSIYFKDILIYNSTETTISGGNYVGFKLRANLGDLSGS